MLQRQARKTAPDGCLHTCAGAVVVAGAAAGPPIAPGTGAQSCGMEIKPQVSDRQLRRAHCGSLSTAVCIPTTKHSGQAHKGARVQRGAQLARLQQTSVEKAVGRCRWLAQRWACCTCHTMPSAMLNAT